MKKMQKKTEVMMLEEEARKGNVAALYNLGYIYLLGQNVEEDAKKAVTYFRRGATHSDGKCMQALAMCFRNGDGVEKDLEKMIYWLNNGVKIHDHGCMYQLALCYEKGLGVAADFDRAVELMKTAQEKNRDARAWLKAHHIAVKRSFFKRFGGRS